MPDFRVRAEERLAMGDAVLFVLDYARSSAEDFAFGPLEEEPLLRDGLWLMGDCEGLVAAMRKEKALKVTVESLG